MVKIYTKGNYFFLVKDNIEYEGHRKEVLIKRLTTTSTDFFFKQVNNWNDSEVVSLSDMVDENDVAYTLQAFLDFRKDETGNFNNGGGNGMGLTELEVETLAIGVDLPTDDYTDLLRNIQFKPIAQNIFLGDIYDAYTNSEAHRQGIKDDYGDGSSETITIPFLRPYTFGGEYSLVNRYIRYLPTEEVKFLKIRTANNTTTGNLVIDIISASEGNEVSQRITKTIGVGDYFQDGDNFFLTIDVGGDITQPTKDYHIGIGGDIQVLYYGLWRSETIIKGEIVAIDNEGREVIFRTDNEVVTSANAWESATLGVNGTASTAATLVHETIAYTAISVGVTNFNATINIQRVVNSVATGSEITYESGDFPYQAEALGGWYNNNRVLVGESCWEEETGGFSSRADIIGGLAVEVGYIEARLSEELEAARPVLGIADNYDFRGYSVAEGDGFPSNQGWDVALENNTAYFNLETNETYNINGVETTGQRSWNLKDTGGSNAAMIQNLTVADINTASQTDGGFAMRIFGKVNPAAANNATVVLILEVQGTTGWGTGNHRVFLNFADDGTTQYLNSQQSGEAYNFNNLDTYVDFLVSVNSDGSAELYDSDTGVQLFTYADVIDLAANGTRFNIASGSGGGTGEDHNFNIIEGYFATTATNPDQITIEQSDILNADLTINYQPNTVNRAVNFGAYAGLAIGAKVVINPNHIGTTTLARTDNAVTFNGFSTWSSSTRGVQIVVTHQGDNTWTVVQGAEKPIKNEIISLRSTVNQGDGATPVVDTETTVLFDNYEDETLFCINGTITLKKSGSYAPWAGPQALGTGGGSAGYALFWLRKRNSSTDSWENVPNSAVYRSVSGGNGSGVSPLFENILNMPVGGQLEWRWKRSDVNAYLVSLVSGATIPGSTMTTPVAIPSIISQIFKYQ